ncbi:MAG TPA: hypothetical protein VEJ19_09300 [Nitrososphaerales archaeon]|nr:hypothetical protein [Nitrososphaerales archaeon]
MKNGAIAALLVATIMAAGVAGYSFGNVNEHTVTSVSTFVTTSTGITTFVSTVLETTTTTSTFTPTAPFQNLITFLGSPRGCALAFCVNSTLVNHLGSNITVVMFAWFRNATTGQNVTTLDKNSADASVCTVDFRRPSTCIIVDFLLSGTYEVTLTVLALDGKTVLSPIITALVTN